MARFKLTSPGVLLILAILAAGGIFLLDTFFLRPRIDEQKWAALRDEAGRAQHGTQLALQSEQLNLRRYAAGLAENLDVVWFFYDKGPQGPAERLDEIVRQTMERCDVRQVWLTNPSGKVLRSWPADNEPEQGGADGQGDNAAEPRSMDIPVKGATEGLLHLASGPAVFSQCPIRSLEQDAS